jgi:hypothetical protein
MYGARGGASILEKTVRCNWTPATGKAPLEDALSKYVVAGSWEEMR